MNFRDRALLSTITYFEFLLSESLPVNAAIELLALLNRSLRN